jgi:hypothetical protein
MAEVRSTRTANDGVYDERNLVVATPFPVFSVEQPRNDLVDPLVYRRLTANPPDAAAVTAGIERPILHVQLDLPNGTPLHVINVHLKSKLRTDIPRPEDRRLHLKVRRRLSRRVLHLHHETDVANSGGPAASRSDPRR